MKNLDFRSPKKYIPSSNETENTMDFSEKLKHRRLYGRIRLSDTGKMLSEYLAEHFSRWDTAGWKKEILSGKVLVNEQVPAPETILCAGDLVSYYPGDLPEPEADLRFRLVYEDSDLLVLDKSGDLCVHPTGPFFRNTLWHLAGSQYGEIRFVNRLDRETSGLLVAAKNLRTAAGMNNHSCFMEKEYLALVFGRFEGTLRAKGFLEHDEQSSVFKKKRFVFSTKNPDAETADTELRAETYSDGMTLVRAIPHTGRQHQIRATLHSIGFPLVGDKLYGPDENIFLKIKTRSVSEADFAKLGMKRQALHSAKLVFRHPISGEIIRCESPLPDDFPVRRK